MENEFFKAKLTYIERDMSHEAAHVGKSDTPLRNSRHTCVRTYPQNVMATFSLLGSLLLGVVWSVSGPELARLADDSLWGDARDAAHTTYRAITTCAAVL